MPIRPRLNLKPAALRVSSGHGELAIRYRNGESEA